jgi:hypothetical protein
MMKCSVYYAQKFTGLYPKKCCISFLGGLAPVPNAFRTYFFPQKVTKEGNMNTHYQKSFRLTPMVTNESLNSDK